MTKTLIDRRVARTRAMLHEALMSLIAEKGYEPITVGDICDRADIGRSTFYAHYASKDDLMRSGFDHLRDIVMDSRTDGSAQPDPGGLSLAFSRTMLEHARDHVHLHQSLGERGGTIAHDTIRQILSDLIRSELAASAGKDPVNAMPRELVVQYVVGAYMAVVTWWLRGGAKLAPQQVDAMFRRLASEGIAHPL